MPLTDEEKRRINNSLSLESLRIEHVRIAREIQSQGFSRGRTDALLAQLNTITETRRQQLPSSEHTSSERPNNQTVTNEQHIKMEREERHFTKRDFRRFNELILHESEAVALQIYHPTTCDLHSDSDTRILRLKDGGNKEIDLYAEVIAQVLPVHGLIFLACVPSSSPHGGQSLKSLVSKVARKSSLYKDIAPILRTTQDRGKKSHGHRFSDEDLAQTITVDPQYINEAGVIILLDDVVTSGQSFRVCTAKLRGAGVQNDILCLAVAKTDRHSRQQGIADIVFNRQSILTTPTHTHRASEHKRPSGVDSAHRRERVHQGSSSSSNSSITQTTHYKQNSQRKQASSSKDDCFVITAIYEGNFEHENVQVLRKWRDEKLIKSTSGKILIDIYYKIGPTLAQIVKQLHLTKPLRSMLEMLIGHQP